MFWSDILQVIKGQMTQIKKGFCPPKKMFAKIYFSTSLDSPSKMLLKLFYLKIFGQAVQKLYAKNGQKMPFFIFGHFSTN